MTFLSHEGLFFVFLLLFLIDVTFLVKEAHHRALSALTLISAVMVLFDASVLKKIAKYTVQDKPDPIYRVRAQHGSS